MGFRLPSVVAVVPAAIQTSSAAETIAVTTAPISPPADSGIALIFWWLDVLMSTGATSLTVHLRRGAALTAPVINALTGTDTLLLAGQAGQVSGCYVDQITSLATVQYSLTATAVGQTANGQIRDGALIVMFL